MERANEYQKWAETVDNMLKSGDSWENQYKEYAQQMLKNENAFIEAKRHFRVRKPLYAYLTIGNAKDNNISFDLRYLGQSVGTISVNGEKAILNVSKKHAEDNKKYFGYELGKIDKADWEKSADARRFRKLFCDESKGLPRQKEHMVESALFSETEKKASKGKTLCNITPVSYAGTRIHMKTAVKASKAKGGIIEVSHTGGEVDLLCRRSVKPGRGESRLVVIEIKDENKKNESFDLAIKQAITYAVFIRRLIYSDAGENWMKLWGMKNQRKSEFTIDCAVAMPKGKTKPSYLGKKIEFISNEGKKDYIELHSMEFNAFDSKNVTFEHSF